jgi:predicted N-acetyltransferase YhbS
VAERWQMTEARTGATAAVLAEVAAVTRAAFRGRQLVPGLPAPDGATETAISVAADLAAGAWLGQARDRDGALVGSVRAFTRATAEWEVRRLAVVPAARGSGLAQALMCFLEERAAEAGAPAVVLNSVVERGNPPFYARIGYPTVRHFPNPDKPLSEVAMRRELSRPAETLAYPWQGELAPRAYGVLVTWHTDGRRTVARVHHDVDDALELAAAVVPGMTFAGADGRREPDGAPALRSGEFAGPPAAVSAYRMPRALHPELLALWRVHG